MTNQSTAIPPLPVDNINTTTNATTTATTATTNTTKHNKAELSASQLRASAAPFVPVTPTPLTSASVVPLQPPEAHVKIDSTTTAAPPITDQAVITPTADPVCATAFPSSVVPSTTTATVTTIAAERAVVVGGGKSKRKKIKQGNVLVVFAMLLSY